MGGCGPIEVFQAVANRKLAGNFRGVRHDQQGDALVATGRLEEINHLLLMRGVDAGSRLIGQEHSGAVGKRSGDGHPLLLTDAQRRRLVMEPFSQTDGSQ
jgi:hypothetical protein